MSRRIWSRIFFSLASFLLFVFFYFGNLEKTADHEDEVRQTSGVEMNSESVINQIYSPTEVIKWADSQREKEISIEEQDDSFTDMEISDDLHEQIMGFIENRESRIPNAPVSSNASDIADYLIKANLNHEEAKQYVNIIREGAEGGDIEAMRSLADLIEMGIVESLEPSESFLLYLSAAEAGDALAARQVGFHYEQGLGVEVDVAAAVEWYLYSAELGNSGAWVDVGFLHSSNAYGEPDLNKAHEYYDLAINEGDSQGYLFKAMDYLSGWEQQAQEINKAISLLYKAAALDDGDAHLALAAIFQTNRFGRLDLFRSFSHLVAALNLDNPLARYSRGSTFLSSDNDFFYNEGWHEMTTLANEGHLNAATRLASELLKYQRYGKD